MADAARRYRFCIAIGVILIIAGHMIDHSAKRMAAVARARAIGEGLGNLKGSLREGISQAELIENLGAVSESISVAQGGFATITYISTASMIVLWLVGLTLLSMGLYGWAGRKDYETPAGGAE